MRILQISPAQYEALAEVQLDEFVERLKAALVEETPAVSSSPDLPDLKALVLRARDWKIEEEQDVYDLARLRFLASQRFLDGPAALEILEDQTLEGWLKVFQLRQLLAAGGRNG